MSKNFELMQGSKRPGRLPLSASAYSTGTQPSYSQTDEADIQIGAVLNPLLRRWRWIALSMLVAVALAGIVCLVIPRQYKAESKIEILKQNAGLSVANGSNAPESTSDSMEFALNQQTQLAVLKSDDLAWQVIRELNLVDPAKLPSSNATQNASSEQSLNPAPQNKSSEEALRTFKRHLKVEAVPGTRLISVSYRDRHPEVAARVVNKLVSDYVEYNFQVRYKATAKATDWLSQQLAQLKTQVEESQARAAELEKNSGIFGEDEHHNIVLTRLEQLNNEVTAAETDRVVKEALYKLSRSGDTDSIAGLLGSTPGSTNPQMTNLVTLLTNLRQQEASLSAEKADAASKYGPAYPKLIQLNQRLESVRASIRAELSRIAGLAKNQYELAASRESAAKKYFAEQKSAAAEMNDHAVDFLMAKQEADSNRALYQHLLERLKEAGMIAGLRASDLHVVDPAKIPIQPYRPNIPLYLGVGAFAGLLFGVFGVLLQDYRDHGVRDIAEIESTASAIALGVIPDAKLIPVNSQKRLVAQNGHQDGIALGLQNPAVAEAFRAIRTSLMFSEPGNGSKVFIVTSGMAQEGKTFTSLNLAAAFACTGRDVLLVDADLRRGTLSRVLKQHTGAGLSELLSGDEDPGVYRSVDYIPGLTFVSAGAAADGPAELLGSSRMAEVVSNWRRNYSYVLIDTPPVLPVTDAVVVSPFADAVVLVVRFAVTTRESVAHAVRLLRHAHSPRISVLVNGMDTGSPEYYHYAGSYDREEYGESQLLIKPDAARAFRKESA